MSVGYAVHRTWTPLKEGNGWRFKAAVHGGEDCVVGILRHLRTPFLKRGSVFQDSEPTIKDAPSWLKCNSLLWQHLFAAGLEHLKSGGKRRQQAVGLALGGRSLKRSFVSPHS